MKLTLLEKEQVYGEKRLKVFDLIGTSAALTDYAILCGAFVAEDFYVGEEELENRTSWYWTKTDAGNNKVHVVYFCEAICDPNVCKNINHSTGCVRIALPFSEIKDFCSEEIIGENGESKYICGEFPQQVVFGKLEQELKQKLKNGQLIEVDDITPGKEDHPEIGFQRQEKIYEDEETGKRYTLVKAHSCNDEECILSNGKTYKEGEEVFVERQPLYWIKDQDTDIVFSEKLITPAQFNHINNYQGDFESTDIYRYMNTDLVREIFGSYQKNRHSSSYEEAIKQLKEINKYLKGHMINMNKYLEEYRKEIEFYIEMNNSIIEEASAKIGFQKVNRDNHKRK